MNMDSDALLFRILFIVFIQLFSINSGLIQNIFFCLNSIRMCTDLKLPVVLIVLNDPLKVSRQSAEQVGNVILVGDINVIT